MEKIIVFCSKIILAILATIASLFLTSCKYEVDLGNGIDGNGKVKTENRTVTEKFTKIHSKKGLEVLVEQAPNTEIQVEADENLLKHITTQVENGTLIVSSDENIDSAEKMVVRVKMPDIEAFESTSGSSIATTTVIKGPKINLKTSSGSEIKALVEYDYVFGESTSGSNLSVSGKTLKFTSSSSSGSTLEAGKLLANDVIAEATSGSSIEVHPLVMLNGKASSGASINFNGKPKTVTKEESSGGSVSQN